MNRRIKAQVCRLLVGAVIVAGAATGIAQGTDPAYGTWKLNLAKSKFSPGPAPKEATVVIEAAGPGRKVVVTGIAADGTPVSWGYSGNLDSKDIRLTGTNPDADVVAIKRMAPNATRSTYKLAGKRTLVSGVSVSADGKTLTVATTGVNAKGQTVKNTQVFEKQ
jgi:hypothetical protein